jgi:purine nucleoside permease
MGTYQSLMRLGKLGKVDKERLLVLRTASNFTMQWSGVSAYESLAGEKLSGKGYSAYIPALEAAYLVGQPVMMELKWEMYIDRMPLIHFVNQRSRNIRDRLLFGYCCFKHIFFDFLLKISVFQ